MTHPPRISKLEESVRLYKEVIVSFQGGRERMLARRRGACDSVMHLDESLKLNERTLASLGRVLKAAEAELQSEMNRLKR